MKYRGDANHKIVFLGVFDEQDQTPVKVALFNDHAEVPPDVGDVIRISNVYPWRRKRDAQGAPNNPSLTTKIATKVEA